jgi:hypothetical protein
LSARTDFLFLLADCCAPLLSRLSAKVTPIKVPRLGAGVE